MEKVGFLGLGIMGAAMARNLVEAGHGLVVHNRTRAKARELAGHGAQVADSPREVAEKSDVVVTMLPGPPEIEEVVAGKNGLLEGAAAGSLIIDMSTSSPALARELSRTAKVRGVGMLDAPVSGGDVGAREGTLSIMVGGEENDFGRARPLFGAMGETVVHVGAAGAGQVVKACNQVVVALIIEAVSEALVLSSKAGVAPERVLEVLSGGLAANKVLEVKGKKLLSHDFAPGGKAEYHRKDLCIALAAGREYGVALPVTALVDQMFGALVAKGRGGWDHSALLTLIEEGAGEEARRPSLAAGQRQGVVNDQDAGPRRFDGALQHARPLFHASIIPDTNPVANPSHHGATDRPPPDALAARAAGPGARAGDHGGRARSHDPGLSRTVGRCARARLNRRRRRCKTDDSRASTTNARGGRAAPVCVPSVGYSIAERVRPGPVAFGP